MRYAVLLILSLLPQMANAICEIPLASDTSRVSKGGDTMTGSLIMSNVPISLTGTSGYISNGSSITTTGGFFGPLVGNVTGNCSGNAGTVTNGVYTTRTITAGNGLTGGGDLSADRTLAVQAANTTISVAAGGVSVNGANLTSIPESGVTNLTTDLAAKAADASVVHLTGSENISGTKAFTNTGNGNYSLTASSGMTVGADLAVNGTVAANKFKGDGSQLTGIGGGGTVTTQGSPAAGQVAVFQAGTVISTGPISYTPSAGLVISSTFSISTFTFLTADYTSVTRAAGVCLPGSTITWTASGTLPAMLHFGGGQVQTFSSVSGQTNILVDGQYVDGYGPSVYMWWTNNSAAVRNWFPVEINHRMTSILSAGSHSACLSTQSDSGGPRGLNCDAANHARCYFRVYETHE